MKRFLVLCLVFLLAGCGGAGYGGNPWGTHSGTAQQAPRALGPAATVPVAQQQLPGGINSGAQDGLWQDPAARQQQDQSQYNTAYNRQGGFDVTIGGQAAKGTEVRTQTGTPPTIPGQAAPVAAAPSLPPVKVALLLPLSGQNGDIGQAMLQAAQLALFDMGYNAFELMPRDTQGTPQGAQQAAQSAIESGSQLILGPLFASSTRAVQPIARRHNINVISFSTDWTLAGNNVFVMGFLPFVQVQRIAEFAARQGVQNVGIFAPNTDYGNAVIAAYNSVAYRTGLSSADVVRFAPDQTDFSQSVRDFTNYDERVEFFKQAMKPLEETLKKNPSDATAAHQLEQLRQQQSDMPQPFDAVMLPVGGDKARSIASMMDYFELDKEQVMRIGTGLWDDPGLATEPALQGAFFAASSPDLRVSFERNYRATYGVSPPRLATLAYDATALAAVLTRNNYQQTGRSEISRSALINPNGFSGIDGIFRFRPDGLVERGLAVLQFKDSRIVVADPAPRTFQQWTGQ